MLLIEYRVCLPLSVREYQVAQLYMIMKKSKQESESAGSRVEILCNEPYLNGPGNTSGQYTRKHYHIGERLPKWATSIITKPVLEEEAWNAYPYTKTQYTCYQAPSMIKDNFAISIETRYLNDIGNSENVFNLTDSELRQRRVYHLDMINDYKDVYIEEEDPLKFKSEKTGRGPLTKTWIKDREGSPDILCAYKLCRIRFDNYFFGQKVENDLIHERALKKLLIHSHRQAWCWQDEYFGLTMDRIRELEAEAAEELKRRFASLEDDGRDGVGESEREGSVKKKKRSSTDRRRSSSVRKVDTTVVLNGQQQHSANNNNNNGTANKEADGNGENRDTVTGRTNETSSCSDLEKSEHVEGISTHMSPCSPDKSSGHGGTEVEGGSFPEEEQPEGDLTSECFLSDVDSSAGSDTEFTEGANDDEFFDAVSQQMYNSTLILDFNENEQSQDCSILEKSRESSGSSTDVSSKNVLLLLAADSTFKGDKTSFSDYEQSFKENIHKIMQRFFRTNPDSAILKSFLVPSQLIDDLHMQLGHISTKNVTSGRGQVSSDCTDGSRTRSPAYFASSLSMSTAALFLATQPSYDSVLDSLCHSLNSYVCELKLQYSHLADLEFTVICDNLSSILFHDLLTQFSSNSRKESENSSRSVKLDFDISSAYYLGSSLGFVLSFYGNGDKSSLTFPLYNLFFAEDSSATRIEPMLLVTAPGEQIAQLPFKLTSYQDLFKHGSERHRKLDIFPDVRGRSDFQLWSGHNSEDQSFMELVTKIRGMHALYWESFDVAFFILSNFTSHAVQMSFAAAEASTVAGPNVVSDSPENTITQSSLENSLALSTQLANRKFNHNDFDEQLMNGSSARKAKSFPPIHVLNDVTIVAGSEVMITGRFGYRVGVFVTKLSKEPVELQIRQEVGDPDAQWSTIGQVHTGSKGRVLFNYAGSCDLKLGLYSLRAICLGDLSEARATLCVLPPQGAEAVAFSIDGTFADSVSLTGSNSKLRNSSVELVKFWSALGYLVIYASARPNIMKHMVKSWLDAHGFPTSICLFVEGLSTPDKSTLKKGTMLKQLSENVNLSYFAAYGSQKDLAMYASLGVSPERTFIFPDRITGTRSKNSPQSLLPCATISRNGIPSHVNNLRLKSQALTAKVPLHFAMQASRRSVPKSMSGSTKTLFQTNNYSQIFEESNQMQTASNTLVVSSSKSKGLKLRLNETFSKRETLDRRQSKTVEKFHIVKPMNLDTSSSNDITDKSSTNSL